MRYVLITYIRKPNGQIDEQLVLAKKVKTSDLQTCNVILDYAEQKVIRCIIEGKVIDTDWERLSNYYAGIYPDLDKQLRREASTDAKVEAKAEEDAAKNNLG